MRSLKRAALVAALSVGAVMALASPASAVTLYTDSSTSTVVSTGSTAVGTDGNGVTLVAAGFLTNTCLSSSLTAEITDNGSSSGVVEADITNSTWNNCFLLSVTSDHSTPWKLSTDGTPGSVAGSFAGQVDNVLVRVGSTWFSGSLIDQNLGGSGIGEWRNNGAGAASVYLDDAGALSPANGEVTGAWVLQGSAAGWTID